MTLTNYRPKERKSQIIGHHRRKKRITKNKIVSAQPYKIQFPRSSRFSSCFFRHGDRSFIRLAPKRKRSNEIITPNRRRNKVRDDEIVFTRSIFLFHFSFQHRKHSHDLLNRFVEHIFYTRNETNNEKYLQFFRRLLFSSQSTCNSQCRRSYCRLRARKGRSQSELLRCLLLICYFD